MKFYRCFFCICFKSTNFYVTVLKGAILVNMLLIMILPKPNTDLFIILIKEINKYPLINNERVPSALKFLLQ